MITTKTTYAFEPMNKMHHLFNYLLRTLKIKSKCLPSIAKSTITHVPKCHIHKATCSGLRSDSAMSRRLDWRPPEVPSNLNDPIIVCSCSHTVQVQEQVWYVCIQVMQQ